ncbi:MAG: hypothetical protein PHS73_03275 [Candidatus Peribacteraceae bacterium]|nr:hypothetical protein [Candidatus Peribacteraceae bacterium]
MTRRHKTVTLGKGIVAPHYFHVSGVVLPNRFVRVANERDWTVYRISGWPAPVAMVWNVSGQERLFITHCAGHVPCHKDVPALIERWHDQAWTLLRYAYKGVIVPIVTHDNYGIVPEPDGAISIPEDATMLTVEPPCLLWHEYHPSKEDGSAIAAIVTIH